MREYRGRMFFNFNSSPTLRDPNFHLTSHKFKFTSRKRKLKFIRKNLIDGYLSSNVTWLHVIIVQ